jgi:hypothetical protein
MSKSIRVSDETYATIKLLAKKGNRSMTGQVTELLALVSHPENGHEVIDGVAIISKAGDLTKITEKTVVSVGRCMGHEVE